MNFSNINTIARYEAKILRRTWSFLLLALVSLVGVSIFQVLVQGNMVRWFSWNVIALSSYVPYLNVYLYSIIQVLPVVFLACDMLDRDRKIDMAETIYTRSLSNTDYVIGKALGAIQVFMGLSLLSLLSGVIINIFFTDASLNVGIYLFYWIVFLFPSLVFLLGLTFLSISFVRNKPLTILLVFGYVFLTLFCLNKHRLGLFDFLGFVIPSTLSDITGFPDLCSVLLQRLSWLFLGVSFIGYSISLLKRIPNRPGCAVVQTGVSTLIVLIGFVCGLSLFLKQQENISCRERYRATYEKYRSIPKLTLKAQNITYCQVGDRLKVNTRLSLKNKHAKEVTPVILYLNPGLKVDRIVINNNNTDFYRENQVIVVDEAVKENDMLDLEVEYSGKIDESICYLELPDEDVAGTWNIGSELFRSGKRYAFLEKDYTLLTPECIWYPVSVPPVNLSSAYAIEKDFTMYSLQVIGENRRTVLSQGERVESGDTLAFKNKHNLSGISLCIGIYKSYKLMVDSISVELCLVEGHDDFLENLRHIIDSMPEMIREFKYKLEEVQNRKYPYERFTIVEAPISFAAYFRNERGGSEKVQPEIVFLPERGVGFWRMNLKKSIRDYKPVMAALNMDNADVERLLMTGLLDDLFIFEYDALREPNPLTGRLFTRARTFSNSRLKGNPFILTPLFYDHVNYLYSPEYPIMNMVLNNLLHGKRDGKENWINDFSTRSGSYKKAMNYLKHHSLKEALEDPSLTSDILFQLIKLKSATLKEQYFSLLVSSADFEDFITHYWEKHKFEKIDFSDFDREFAKRFGISWSKVLPEWYLVNRIPSFVIRDAYVKEIESGEEIENYYDKRYLVHASVYNESDVDGVVSLIYAQIPKPRSNSELTTIKDLMPTYSRNVLIEAKKAKKIVLVSSGIVSSAFLNTIISENLPTIIPVLQVDGKTRETDIGVRDIDVSYFFPQEGELIVDNESDNFSITQISNGNCVRQGLKTDDLTNEYNAFTVVKVPEKWTLVTHYGFYGDRVRSGCLKKSGDGKFKAEWSVNIEKAGYYELSVFIPDDVDLYRLITNSKGMAMRNVNMIKQFYTVYHDGKEAKITVEVPVMDRGWISLGRFYFTPGEASVVLTDKGNADDQIIYADAVKWVFKGKDELPEK